jgi:DNA repair ATPase RecN
MSNHTPGPWNVVGEAIRSTSQQKWRLRIHAKELLADVYHGANDEELEATARLISAAPELYEACRKFIRWINEGQPASTKNVLSDAEAAVAKAEGRGA